MDKPNLLPPASTMDEYRGVFSRREVWLPAIKAICERHRLPVTALTQPELGSSIVFRVGEKALVKLFPPLFSQDFFSEKAALSDLSGLRQPAVPAILDEGNLETWNYLVLSPLEGIPLDQLLPSLSPLQREQIARSLGEAMAAVQAVPPPALRAVTPAWEGFQNRQLETVYAVNQQAGAGADWLADLHASYLDFPAEPLLSSQPCLIHADLNPEHVFCQPAGEGWRVSGVIDFGDAMVGMPEYDLVCPGEIFAGHPRQTRALLSGMGVQENKLTRMLSLRLTGFILLHRFFNVTLFPRIFPLHPPANMNDLRRLVWPFGEDLDG